MDKDLVLVLQVEWYSRNMENGWNNAYQIKI